MYASWDMERNRQNFLSFWTVFSLLPPYGPRKLKFSKTWRNNLKNINEVQQTEFLSFWTVFYPWLGRQYNKFYWNLHRQKFLFFWRLKSDLSFNFFIYHKKSKIMNWTKHFITTIYMWDRCNAMLKSFQLQTFLFFLILQYPFLS